MIAVDTNLLIYAHRRESEWHEAAGRCVRELAEGRGRWAIPWPCVHEFLATVTRARVFVPPTALATALETIQEWMTAPTVTLLAEGPSYWEQLRSLLAGGQVLGSRIHDARIAAICLSHGVDELWSADRDFSRFPSLKVRNPLIP